MKPRDWLARFQAMGARMDADLEALVSHESPSEDAERVSSLARWVRDRLIERGVAGETRTCPGRGDAVVASVGGGTEGALLLGHLDTVWPAGTLEGIPFRVEGDRATGPGVFDMKAGIVVAMAALEALAADGDGAAATLLLVPDEETRSHASRGLLLDLAGRHRRALVLEPSLDGAAKVARKGAGLFRLRFHGRAAHAGLEPDKGASALGELARAVLFLEALADPSKETTVVPTLAQSGSRVNVVPEEASLSVDARAWTGEEARRLETSIRGYPAADPRVVVEVEGGFDYPPLEPTPASQKLFVRAREIGLELGQSLDAARVGGASDGCLTAAAGVPTLDGLGPRGGGAHARDEFVLLSDLPWRAALVASLAADLE
ncbi:MAG: M20 family metallopeptidase [Thermoanaerobaculia bacterium]